MAQSEPMGYSKGKRNPMWLAAARAAAARDEEESMQSVADTAGVSRRTMYRYFEDSEFNELVAELATKALTRHLPQVDLAMLKAAKGGSVGAAQQVYQRGGWSTQVIEDKGFKEFLKRLSEEDRLALEYREKHGIWPDEADLVMPEAKGVQ